MSNTEANRSDAATSEVCKIVPWKRASGIDGL